VIVFAVIRNETEMPFRNLLLNTLGIEGALMIAFSAVMGMRSQDFLPGEGVILLALGILYAGAYIGLQEAGNERAHYATIGFGVVGAIGLVVSLICSIVPDGSFLSPYSGFFIPSGLIFMTMSIVCISIYLGIVSDWPIVLLARRDLAAYFYSPIAYLVLLGMTAVGFIIFAIFATDLEPRGGRGGAFEPIVGSYIFNLYPVIVQMFIIPVLTMRLFSEEKRTGTLEVLMTAPVNEISVVIGKFLACWIFFMLTWLPWWLYLVSLRYYGGQEFDYRPVLSFTIALSFSGGALVAMGLFFSSMTSNQIIAAVLTFVGMMLHLVFYLLIVQRMLPEGSALYEIVRYVNFFELWLNSLQGTLAPRYLIFHASVAIFFLFGTVKMLESRKWA
jgi:ABC-type transport system involved in multi-copper enzyme maturation permease subunit